MNVIKMESSPKSTSYTNNSNDMPLLQGNADFIDGKIKIRQYTTEPTQISNLDDILLTLRAPVGDVYINNYGNVCIGRGICSIKSECNEFMYQYLLFLKEIRYWDKLEQGSTFTSIKSIDVKTLKIPSINLNKQKQIGNFLSNVDKLIESKREEIKLKEEYKKGIIQKIFNKEIRFKDEDGNYYPEWEEKKLGGSLGYIQPTKFITKDIQKTGNTPVLTANKSFIKGYTNDSEGIYFGSSSNCIIFDDFTTDCKFIDFNFKIKSSAIKILHLKDNDNLKFLYYVIKNYDYEKESHRRHWIEIFSNFNFHQPTLYEQYKICEFIEKIELELVMLKKELEKEIKLKNVLLKIIF